MQPLPTILIGRRAVVASFLLPIRSDSSLFPSAPFRSQQVLLLQRMRDFPSSFYVSSSRSIPSWLNCRSSRVVSRDSSLKLSTKASVYSPFMLRYDYLYAVHYLQKLSVSTISRPAAFSFYRIGRN